MTQEMVNEARSRHLKDELDYQRATTFEEVKDLEEKKLLDAHKHRGILLDWIDLMEKDRARLITEYRNEIDALHAEIEELTSPKFADANGM